MDAKNTFNKYKPLFIALLVLLGISVLWGSYLLIQWYKVYKMKKQEENLPLLFKDKVSGLSGDVKSFETGLRLLANNLGLTTSELMFVMDIESNVNAQAVNPNTKATGLIQFMPKTAISLGTTVDMLKQMTATQQLVFVEKYLAPYKSKIANVYDLYFAIFYPAAIGKPDNYSLPAFVTPFNNLYDLNKDGKIQVGEIKSWIQNRIKVKVPSGYNSLIRQ